MSPINHLVSYYVNVLILLLRLHFYNGLKGIVVTVIQGLYCIGKSNVRVMSVCVCVCVCVRVQTTTSYILLCTPSCGSSVSDERVDIIGLPRPADGLT